jgi:hypothetical protein
LPVTTNLEGCMTNTYSERLPLRNADLTSIW